ncbi:glycosyltransferase family 2 protein [Methylocaldum sp.]|uniref:glycosyltransferase family 2 protein n=1 Tax=Methylocaldum sp. TaxID=1969727 RepID=UPI002D74CD7D|nr:glycosyltransferase family 2 protein [Methylocaldum sp.]HYE37789.1 glycosyltransferase family 2 protein [Methylocaldum sp.]
MASPILAIVVPCYNEQEIIQETIHRLTELLKTLINSNIVRQGSFICLVDDGSSDRTWELIKTYSETDNTIHGLKLSKNFGHQNALLAGLLRVKDQCDCAISIDADLQQDETAIPRFLEEYSKGFDIVLGVRRDRETDGLIKRGTAELFYGLMSLMGVTIVRNHADYRLLSKRALDALAQFEEGNLFLRGLIHQLGFNTSTVNFDVRNRTAGISKYTFRKMLSFAFNGITSFSVVPLRVIAALGGIFTLISLIMSIYVVARKFLFADAIPGWASVVLPIYLLGGIQLFSFGIIGEYIGRIYLETKRRPRFIIEDDLVN